MASVLWWSVMVKYDRHEALVTTGYDWSGVSVSPDMSLGQASGGI